MNKIILIENRKYTLIKNYRDAFQEEEFLARCTDYFYDYDYIVGDIAYGKLRLKGFYTPQNKKVKKINNYKEIDRYFKDNCAVDCKHFILKRMDENEI